MTEIICDECGARKALGAGELEDVPISSRARVLLPATWRRLALYSETIAGGERIFEADLCSETCERAMRERLRRTPL